MRKFLLALALALSTLVPLEAQAAETCSLAGATCLTVEYGPNKKHRLDLYCPTEQGTYPVVIFVHGGGWQDGDKRDLVSDGVKHQPYLAQMDVLTSMVSSDYCVISMNYRLAPDYSWPAPAQDVDRVLGWVADNAVLRGLNPNRIGLWGSSAGGQIAAYAAAKHPGVKALANWFGPTDLRSVSPDAEQFLVPEFGPPSDPRRWEASPLRLAGFMPPTLNVFGSLDTLVPEPTQGRPFRNALNAAGIPNSYIVVVGGHGDQAGMAASNVAARTESWFKVYV